MISAPPHTILLIIQMWLLSDTPPTIESFKTNSETLSLERDPDYLFSVHCALTLQDQIGWPNFFRGYPASLWALLPPSDIPPPFQRSAVEQLRAEKRLKLHAERMKGILRAIQVFTSTMWKARCSILHSTDPAVAPILHASIDNEIRSLYANKHTFPTHVQRWFRFSLESILKRNSRARSNWLQMARIIVPGKLTKPAPAPIQTIIRKSNSKPKRPKHSDYPRLYAWDTPDNTL